MHNVSIVFGSLEDSPRAFFGEGTAGSTTPAETTGRADWIRIRIRARIRIRIWIRIPIRIRIKTRNLENLKTRKLEDSKTRKLENLKIYVTLEFYITASFLRVFRGLGGNGGREGREHL